MYAAKFVVAAIGGAVSALLAIVPEGSTTYNVLTVISVTVTAVLVYLVPNKPAASPQLVGKK